MVSLKDWSLPRFSFCLALGAVPFLGYPAICALGISAALLGFETYRSTRVSEVAELQEQITALRADHTKMAMKLGVSSRG